MASSENSAKGKVTGSAGRFGCRYGRFVRKRVAEMEKISRADHRCPKCDTISVQRRVPVSGSAGNAGTNSPAVHTSLIPRPFVSPSVQSTAPASLKRKLIKRNL